MNKHILTIDDETEIRDVLKAALTFAGYRVTAVSTAAEGLQVVRIDPPHLVITDLQLQETDGFAVFSQVKAIDPRIPVLVLTGMLVSSGGMRGALEGKADGYIEKTAPLEKIMQEISRHLPA